MIHFKDICTLLKKPRQKIYTAFSRNAGALFADCEDFCFAANEQISQKPYEYPLAGTALHSIGADIIALHRAVRVLCEAGWAFSCPLLLRTQMEDIINLIALTAPSNAPEYMAFKYFHSYLLPLNESEIAETSKIQIHDDLNRLDSDTRKKAEALLESDKKPIYWYQPEFKNPSNLYDKHTILRTLWNRFSGTAHGGFLGIRILRDDKNAIHPEPRADQQSQDKALLLSSRLIVEFFRLRCQFEHVHVDEEYQRIVSKFSMFDNRVDYTCR